MSHLSTKSEAKKDKKEEREDQDDEDKDEEWESLGPRCQILVARIRGAREGIGHARR